MRAAIVGRLDLVAYNRVLKREKKKVRAEASPATEMRPQHMGGALIFALVLLIVGVVCMAARKRGEPLRMTGRIKVPADFFKAIWEHKPEERDGG